MMSKHTLVNLNFHLPQHPHFELGGYVLKYMYSITTSEVSKFLTRSDFIPVSNDSTVSA